MPRQLRGPADAQGTIPSVADLIAFEALPDETRELAQKVLGVTQDKLDEAEEKGYDAGFEAGREALSND